MSLSLKILLWVLGMVVALSGGLIVTAEMIVANVMYDSVRTSQLQSMYMFESISRGGTLNRRFHINENGDLFLGDRQVRGDYYYTDMMKDITGQVSTIFQRDERVSTNITDANGRRLVGTRLAAGPIYDTVLRDGRDYLGEATIQDVRYYAIYRPIKDDRGNVIGILFLGTPASISEAQIKAVAYRLLLISILVTLAAVVAIGILLRRMLNPIRTIEQYIQKLQNNDFSFTVAPNVMSRKDEIGSLGRATDSFKGKLSEVEAMKEAQKASMLKVADDFDKSVGGIVSSVASAATELQSTAVGM
ncbi:MAG: cache domain-containing protein, partial [Alphaproteobacteria bacterium]|nr:cache domain-containing protein [Alphaproteobacteria bacterium]